MMLKQLTFTLLVLCVKYANGQIIYRLEDGDVIYGHVKQVTETHFWIGNEKMIWPKPDTLKMLTYEYDFNGQAKKFKGYYRVPLSKKLKLLEDQRSQYHKDSSGNQLVSVFEKGILKWTNKLDMEGKVMAITFVDKKGRIKGTRIINFREQDLEAEFCDLDKHGKTVSIRKTRYTADGQLATVKFYDKDKLIADYQFGITGVQAPANWTKRSYINIQGGHSRYHIIQRQYLYYQ